MEHESDGDTNCNVKYSLAHNMRQGKKKFSLCRKKSDAPEESDLWTAW